MKEERDKKEQSEQMIKDLRAGLDQLDQLSQGQEEPDLTFFLQHVQKTKEASKKKLIRDLMIFWGIALVILCVWTATFFHSPKVFLVIQVAATITLPVIGYYFSNYKVGHRL